jgi:hypothetical protein
LTTCVQKRTIVAARACRWTESAVATNNSVFISYRREQGYAWAKLLFDGLSQHGVDTFLDLESMREAGAFDVRILNQIAARPYFVPVLLRGSLKRCRSKDDWLRREIEQAVATDRTFIPFVIGDFKFREAKRYLPSKAADKLTNSQGVVVPRPEFLKAGVDILVQERLGLTNVAPVGLTEDDRRYAEEVTRRVAELPPPLPPALPPPQWRSRVAIGAGVAALALAIALPIKSLSQGGGGGDDGQNAVPTVPSTVASTPPSTTPSPKDRLRPNDRLLAGDQIATADGRQTLEMRADGLLVARSDGVEFWHAPEEGKPVAGSVAIMQGDGNFVVYRSADQTNEAGKLFATNTSEFEGAYLVVENLGGRGRLRLYGRDGAVLFERQAAPVGGGGGTATTQAPTTTPPPFETTTTVVGVLPDVRGLTARDATNQLAIAGFTKVEEVQRTSTIVPSGRAISTSPGAGSSVDTTTTVTLYISSGSPAITPTSEQKQP